MKKVMMVLAALMLTVLVNGQSLSGYTIGKRLNDSGSKYILLNGVQGLLTASANDYGIISMLLFIPCDSNGNVQNISGKKADNMRKAIEKSFNITFITKAVDGGIGYVTADEKFGLIKTKYGYESGYNVVFMIVDKSLL